MVLLAEPRSLASLIENSSDFIAIASLDGHVQFVNPAGRRMLGLDDERVLRTWLDDYVAEAERKRVRQHILPAVERDGYWEGETRFRHFDSGAVIPMLQHVFYLTEPGSGRRLGLGTISRDITEGKRAEAERLALQEELAGELAAVTNLHELSTRLRAASDLHGLLEEILGAIIALQNADFGDVQLYHPDTRALEIVAQRGFGRAVLAAGAAGGRALRRRERVIVEDVNTDPGFAPHRGIATASGFRAMQSTPFCSRSDEPLGTISTYFRKPHRPSERELKLTDLYVSHAVEMIERKRADAELRLAQDQLALASRLMSLGELTASIAHEVNQPLAAIVANGHACLRWLTRDEPNLGEARAAAERIIRDGNRAGDVLRRIRLLSKPGAARKTWLDVNELIHEVLALAQSEVVRYRASVRMALGVALPPVRGDRVQLQQVVLNLMLNGMEAMAGITDRPRDLTIASGHDGAGAVWVTVRDVGVGLDPRALDQVFEPFFTTKAEGMGLGLSISRRIIGAHGGRLHAEPNPDHGVTVSFTLPLGEEDAG